MGLLANTVANPLAAFQVAGVDFSEARPRRRSTWLSVAVVLALHAAGLYAIATWTPRSEWLTLWKPVEIKLIQEEAPKPPEVVPIEEPPPPPKPQVVERKLEPLPVISQPKVEEMPVVPEPPAPVITAAPSAPAAVEAPTFVVPPQPEAPSPPPAPRVQAAAPPAPRTVARVEFIRAPDPAYPMMSRRLGEQGKVMVRALVDEQGHAVDVAIQLSSGKPRLDEAAKKAVMGALFKPYREEGRPEQVYVIVPVIFKMET